MNDQAILLPHQPLASGILAPVAIIVNERSGHLKKDAALALLAEELAARNIAHDIFRPSKQQGVADLARQAAQSSYRTVIAIGGDGTVNTVATELVKSGQLLGVIPMGTFNYFARNLGIPMDIAASVQLLLESRVRQVGVGMVNDRLFLSNSAIGLYPAILLDREQQQQRLGRNRFIAVLSAVYTALRKHPMLKITVEPGHRLIKTPLIYLCINTFQLTHLRLPGSICAASGRLTILVTHNLRRLGLLRLALKLLAGFRDKAHIEELCLEEVQIHTRRRWLNVALDGEVARLRSPLHYRYCPLALHVLAPAVANDSQREGNHDHRD